MFSPEHFQNNSESDREVKQVTHRSYEMYTSLFNLPEEVLTKIKTVVDIGAGFSNFTEEARKKFKGLRSIAVDPVYKLLKDDPDLTLDELRKQDNVHLDFDPQYRGNESNADQGIAVIYNQFTQDMKANPEDYIAASHQNIPLDDNSVDLVLASNSIIRPENKPSIIEKALQECLRVLKEDGEIRVAGRLGCFIFNPATGNVELWYNGDLVPGGKWVEELERTGHYSDPELMKTLVGIENTGVTIHGVVVSDEVDGQRDYRFDTLIFRKDQGKPTTELSWIEESRSAKSELVKLQFRKTDGFNIPVILEG